MTKNILHFFIIFIKLFHQINRCKDVCNHIGIEVFLLISLWLTHMDLIIKITH